MAMDEDLHEALRRHLADRPDIVEKRMFGGSGFMWRGHLLCGVMGDELLVRMGKTTAADLLGEGGAHPMVMGGRTSAGWMLVPMPPDERERRFATWVGRAASYVESLPSK